MTTATKTHTLEDVAKAAGIDVAKARKSLADLDATFGGSHGDIPEGALSGWVNQHFNGRGNDFFMALGRAWEQELAATLPEDRKKERELSAEEWIKERDKKAAAAAAKK